MNIPTERGFVRFSSMRGTMVVFRQNGSFCGWDFVFFSFVPVAITNVVVIVVGFLLLCVIERGE